MKTDTYKCLFRFIVKHTYTHARGVTLSFSHFAFAPLIFYSLPFTINLLCQKVRNKIKGRRVNLDG